MAEYIATATVILSAGVALEEAVSHFLTAHVKINELKRECEHARTELGILRSKIKLYHSSLSTDERTALSNAINDFHDQCDEYESIISNLLKELGKFYSDKQESKAPFSVTRRATWKVAGSKRQVEGIKDELCRSRTRINDIYRHLITDHDHGRRPSLPGTGREYLPATTFQSNI